MTGVHQSDALTQQLSDLRARGEPFVVATVVRTLGATAAKPGAKALLDSTGALLEGWIGGGCVRGALSRAAVDALATREPVLISLHPDAVLDERGLVPGAAEPGVRVARNGCPSEGSMDIFVEPHVPQPELVVVGSSPVARALADLARHFDWALRHIENAEDAALAPRPGRRMVVVSTQGQGDQAGMAAALRSGAECIAFVGSRKKYRALSRSLSEEGFDAAALDAVCAPAGLPINAVTPEEIALSILAQLTARRRQQHREPAHADT
ncbi:MAG: XdhC family protein [Pseudomonadota bacterium]